MKIQFMLMLIVYMFVLTGCSNTNLVVEQEANDTQSVDSIQEDKEEDDIAFVIEEWNDSLIHYGFLISVEGKVVPFFITDEELLSEAISWNYEKILDMETAEPIMTIEQDIMNQYLDMMNNIDEEKEMIEGATGVADGFERMVLLGRKTDDDNNVKYECIYQRDTICRYPTDPNAIAIQDWLIEINCMLKEQVEDTIIFEDNDVAFVIAKRKDGVEYGYYITAGGKVVPFETTFDVFFTVVLGEDNYLDVERNEPVMVLEEGVINRYIELLKNINEDNEMVEYSNTEKSEEEILLIGRTFDKIKMINTIKLYGYEKVISEPTDSNAIEIMNWLLELNEELAE